MGHVKRIALTLVIFLTPAVLMLGQARSRNCNEEPLATATRWGGNERVEMDFRGKPVRSVNGIVWLGDQPSDGSLVQVFRREPSDPLVKAQDQEQGVPVTACVTGSDGRFGFSVPSGEYELRISLNPVVDVTSVFVTVKHSSLRSRKIKVVLRLGT